MCCLQSCHVLPLWDSALQKQNDFIRNKVQSARVVVAENQYKMQQEISAYEKEAQELERMEADLLSKLQQT